MPRALAISGMMVAALLLLLFALELGVGILPDTVGWSTKAPLLICALILAYLGWSAFRDQV